jgi:hypothetical protein
MDHAGQLDLSDLHPRAIPEDAEQRARLSTEKAVRDVWGSIADSCRHALTIDHLPSDHAVRLRRLLVASAALTDQPHLESLRQALVAVAG